MQLQGRISFTQFFMDRLLTGDSIWKGYLKAKNQLSNMGLPYNRMNPQLVEGVSLASTNTMIGGNFAIASLFPEISSQSPSTSISADTTQTFFAELSDLEGIEAVWAVVIPPDYVAPTTSLDLEAPEVGLPSFDLTDADKDGYFEGTYSDFTHNGEYKITFYTRNENGSVTASPASIISVTGGLSTDTDNDGMPDTWEDQYNELDKAADDASSDIDNDGLSNLAEYQNNTDPTDDDSDDDNMKDGWEVDNDLDPNTDDASQDADGDIVSNYQEYLDGTNPQDNADFVEPPTLSQITGRIISSILGYDAGIQDASISLQETIHTTTSAQDGTFSLDELQDDTYSLAVTAASFKAHIQQIIVSGNDIALGGIELEIDMFTQVQIDQAVNDAIANLFTQAELDQAISAEIMNWDINEDGLIGLEEAIHALQVVSGVRSSE